MSHSGVTAPDALTPGDAKLIVWAIAEGRKAARQADEFLMRQSLPLGWRLRLEGGRVARGRLGDHR